MDREAIMNVIHKGTELDGNLNVNGSVRIDGKLKGKVKATEKIVIGQTGIIDGELRAKDINLSGRCKGTISVENSCVLQKTAEFNGDIKCKKLIVEDGVVVDGNIIMREEREKVAQEKPKE